MSQLFNIEEKISYYIAAYSAGETPEISLPEGFPGDTLWRVWPQNLYSAFFLPECSTEPSREAHKISERLKGSTDSLTRDMLLPHLKHRLHTGILKTERREARVLHLLYSLLQDQNESSWCSAEDFISGATEKREIEEYLDPDYAADYVFFETRGYYRNFLGDSGIREEQRYLETPDIYREACLVPLVQNYLGAAALLGILEIRYDQSESPYTPWAGIMEFRLSAWGAYVTGSRKELPEWKPRRVVEFSAEGEIASLRESSPEAQSILNDIGIEIAPGVFGLGKSQILASAAGEAELREIIHRLKAMAIEPIPSFWQEIFDSLDHDVICVTEEPDYLVFQVPDHKDFLYLLREEPAVSSLVIPAAGRRILVQRRHISRLRREIKKRGLLLEITES